MVCFPFPDLTRLDEAEEKERAYLAVIGALLEGYPEGVEISQADLTRRAGEHTAPFVVCRTLAGSFLLNHRRPVAKPAREEFANVDS